MIHIGIEITNIAINVLGKCAKEVKILFLIKFIGLFTNVACKGKAYNKIKARIRNNIK